MRRALGKGLSQFMSEAEDGMQQELRLDAITPNTRQPRTHFDEVALAELADSIRSVGVLQPLLVRELSEGKFELIAGERRLRASKLAGLSHVPVIVRSVSHQASLELALIENVQREDIAPLECAYAYQRLANEFNLTQEQIARRVGKSRVGITNTLRLLKLPEQVLEGLRSGLITEGHARAILAAESPIEQLAAYRAIIARGMNVREAEQVVRREISARGKASPRKVEPEWAELESSLSTYLGSPVELQRSGNGGKLVLRFFSEDDLQRVLDVLGLTL